MAKQPSSAYLCSQCSYSSVKWLGCCPQCNQWESFEKQAPQQYFIHKNAARHHRGEEQIARVLTLSQIETTHKKRIKSGIGEWDRVMGDGIMPESLIILTGDPGIGKSTLLLQVCHAIAQQHRVFYFSTEESIEQIKQRANRVISPQTDTLFISDNANLEAIIACAHAHRPDIMVIDSIQNCYANNTQAIPGSMNQLRESLFQLIRLTKEQHITTIITGHITKEGIIAGPKTLEHMVDAVFYLQGEDRWHSRILRSVKNRFGTIDEVGFFSMNEQGMEEIPNINSHLVGESVHTPGSVLTSIMEGSRSLLLEFQALVVESKLSMPQRVVTGIDHKQVMIIAAILQKYLHVKLNAHDIFFKVSGGFTSRGNMTDLAIALALLSSYFQQPLPEKAIALGEISLTGSIKPINHINFFVSDAQKFGINLVLVAYNQKMPQSSCTVRQFKNIYQLLELFGEK